MSSSQDDFDPEILRQEHPGTQGTPGDSQYHPKATFGFLTPSHHHAPHCLWGGTVHQRGDGIGAGMLREAVAEVWGSPLAADGIQMVIRG